MAEVTAARQAALAILTAVRSGELADRALARHGADLDSRDHAWLQELVYGTLRALGRLDFILAHFVSRRLDTLDPVVHDILRLGVYQLREMDGVPTYAAVSQSVELTRVAGAPKASGLVNGVLQSVRRKPDEPRFPDFDRDPVGDLTSRGSHPRWLIERWIGRYGAEATRELVEANNRIPPVDLRPIGISVDEAVERLNAAGIGTRPVPGFPSALRLDAGANPGDAVRAIPAIVQDPAAGAVVDFVDAVEGATVLDVAAAPGGKTVGLAERAGYVVASDLSPRRLRRVGANARRLGMEARVGRVAADAADPPFRPQPLVLLDAPCAGTGTLRRHPDGRWRVNPAELQSLQSLQQRLLEGASNAVAPGGMLVYSTCSLEPEENEEQVERFLKSHPDFRLAPPPVDFDSEFLNGDFLQLLPQRHGVDGAFAARMERTG